jgi:tRNA A58 N-methylase Trm61
MGLVFNITLYSRIMVDWSVENINLDMILFRMSKDVGVINKRSICVGTGGVVMVFNATFNNISVISW